MRLVIISAVALILTDFAEAHIFKCPNPKEQATYKLPKEGSLAFVTDITFSSFKEARFFSGPRPYERIVQCVYQAGHDIHGEEITTEFHASIPEAYNFRSCIFTNPHFRKREGRSCVASDVNDCTFTCHRAFPR